MKNAKRILIVFMTMILFLIPFGSAFAYTGGLLNGKTLSTGASGTMTVSGSVTQATDNNESTSFTVTGGSPTQAIWYDFVSPVDISTYKLKSSLPVNIIVYVGGTPTVVDGTSINGVSTDFPSTITGVTRIKVSPKTSSENPIIYEFDVFPTPPVVIKTDVTNVDVNTITMGSANVTWSIPTGYSNVTYTGAKVYLDDVLKTTTNSTATTYGLSGLTANTAYNVKVTATYSDGSETTGLVKTFNTPVDSSTIPPSPPTSLIATNVTATTMKLSWSNSADLDLSQVKIYQDSVLIDTVDLTDFYNVTGLTPSTPYVFQVSLIDTDGNESSKALVNVATTIETDTTAPNAPTNVTTTPGANGGSVTWSKSTATDISGYNVYVNGIKHNSSLIINNNYTIVGLDTNASHDITVTAVDTSSNESAPSIVKTLVTSSSLMPILELGYDLTDVATASSNWFSSIWLIIAFSVAIPLAFYVSSRTKLLFLD